MLIDGVYKQELNDDKGLRGSSNQQIHFLTNKYNTVKELFFEENSRNLEFDITLDNDILINGIPKKDFIKELENSLRQEGFELV